MPGITRSHVFHGTYHVLLFGPTKIRDIRSQLFPAGGQDEHFLQATEVETGRKFSAQGALDRRVHLVRGPFLKIGESHHFRSSVHLRFVFTRSCPWWLSRALVRSSLLSASLEPAQKRTKSREFLTSRSSSLLTTISPYSLPRWKHRTNPHPNEHIKHDEHTKVIATIF